MLNNTVIQSFDAVLNKMEKSGKFILQNSSPQNNF